MANDGKITRHIPDAVKAELRREVGFGCPVENCGTPFLEYHHFDPEFSVAPHHRPEGMIALCPTHHRRAAEFSKSQLLSMKRNPCAKEIGEKFLWLREEVVAIVGGNYYHETPHMVVFRGEPIVWYRRNEKNEMMFSFNMLTSSSEPRAYMRDNDWTILGNPSDVICGPVATRLEVEYPNGDGLYLRFREWASAEKLEKKHPRMAELRSSVTYPLSTVEVTLAVGGQKFLGPNSTQLGGVTITGMVSSRCGSGIVFG